MADSDSPEDEVDGSITTSADVRYKHLSTIVTLCIILGYTGIVFAQMLLPVLGYSVGSVESGTWASYSLGFITALAYSVGVDTLKAVKEMRA